MFFSSFDSLVGDSLEFNQANKAPYVFDWENAIVCMQCRGIGLHLMARGKSHGFSRVAAGTWGIFSSYDGDAHSKREFVSEVRTLV